MGGGVGPGGPPEEAELGSCGATDGTSLAASKGSEEPRAGQEEEEPGSCGAIDGALTTGGLMVSRTGATLLEAAARLASRAYATTVAGSAPFFTNFLAWEL